MTANGTTWFCVRTNVRSERRAYDGLSAKRFTAYLPQETVLRRLRHVRKSKPVLRPLFPRYLFVALYGPEPDFYGVRRVDGVESFVGICGKPIAIPASDIDRLQSMEQAGMFNQGGRKKFEPGEQFTVQDLSGAFQELLVTIAHDNGAETVEAYADMFGGLVKVHVPVDKLVISQ